MTAGTCGWHAPGVERGREDDRAVSPAWQAGLMPGGARLVVMPAGQQLTRADAEIAGRAAAHALPGVVARGHATRRAACRPALGARPPVLLSCQDRPVTAANQFASVTGAGRRAATVADSAATGAGEGEPRDGGRTLARVADAGTGYVRAGLAPEFVAVSRRHGAASRPAAGGQA